MTPIEYRIARFQDLINKKGKIYKLMNFNLYILRMCFKKGRGKFIPLEDWEYSNFMEDWNFYYN